MKNPTKHSATIEQYLANEMAPPERSDFRKELRTNPDLADELRFSQAIDSALMQDDIIDLRRKLISAINAGRKANTDVPVIRNRPAISPMILFFPSIIVRRTL